MVLLLVFMQLTRDLFAIAKFLLVFFLICFPLLDVHMYCMLYELSGLMVYMHEVFSSTVLAKLAYSSPAWSGFCSAGDINKLNRFLNGCKSLNYCSHARRLHILLNYLMWQINLFLKPFYLIVIMFYIVSYLKYLTLTSKSCFYDNCTFIIRMPFKGTY